MKLLTVVACLTATSLINLIALSSTDTTADSQHPVQNLVDPLQAIIRLAALIPEGLLAIFPGFFIRLAVVIIQIAWTAARDRNRFFQLEVSTFAEIVVYPLVDRFIQTASADRNG